MRPAGRYSGTWNHYQDRFYIALLRIKICEMDRLITEMHQTFLLLLLTSLSGVGTGQDVEYKCKPRLGCHIPRCDPVSIDPQAAGWNEYPISCVGSQNKTSRPVITRREYSTLLNLYGSQRRTLNSLKKGIRFAREWRLLLWSWNSNWKQISDLNDLEQGFPTAAPN